MAILSFRVTVTTSVTALMGGDRGSAGHPLTGSIQNLGTSDVYLGGATVTAAAGYPLTVGSAIDMDLILIDKLYAITASGTAELAVMQLSV